MLDERSYWMNSEEFRAWADHYDESPVQENEINIDILDWRICCISDLYRAKETAKIICPSDLRQMETALLREVPVRPFMKTDIKLPHFIWMIGARIAWRLGHHSQAETYQETQARISSVLEFIEESGYQSCLLICHGFLMWTMNKPLIQRGYHGLVPRHVKNGKLYMFHKK